MSLDTAVATLASAASKRPTGASVEERIHAVQTLLARDLDEVNATLSAVVRDGPEPASNAASLLVDRGGKRIRPLALLLSTACFGPVSPVAREMAVVAELVHSATLLHDDVVDEGVLRRGAPASRRIWGNGISVLGGDLLLVHSLARTLEFAPTVLPDLVRTLKQLVEGEIIQLRGRTQLDVSEATYERILHQKTASLFAWATRTGARVAGAPPAAQEHLALFGERLGVAFQLVDDVLDYEGENTGKRLLADLVEGKVTLPLVLATQKDPGLLVKLARIHVGDEDPVAEVSKAVIDSGACELVRNRARESTALAVAALRSVSPGGARSLLEMVAFQLADRVG